MIADIAKMKEVEKEFKEIIMREMEEVQNANQYGWEQRFMAISYALVSAIANHLAHSRSDQFNERIIKNIRGKIAEFQVIIEQREQQ